MGIQRGTLAVFNSIQFNFKKVTFMTNTTSTDKFQLISDIADRVIATEILAGWRVDKLSLFMDIDHANDQFDIDLKAWLESSDMNFSHDFIGIFKNMNRETKEVENCFTPRFAR
jgi:hypothetical protein